MADYVWYPVTGDGQSAASPYVWNGGQQNWNTTASWGANNLLDLTSAPPAGAVPGSGTGGSSGFGLDNVFVVAGEISSAVFGLYVPSPTLGDPYIGSNNYPVDIVINTGTVGIANLSLANYNALADAPTYVTLDVEGATFDITGSVFNSVNAVTPTIVFFGNTLGGSVTATGGGTIEIGTGGVVEVAGSVQANVDFAFVDGTGDRLVLSGVSPTATADFAGTIEGFAVGDTIDLGAVAYTGGQPGTIASGGILTLTEGTHTYSLQFDPSLAGKTILAAADLAGTGTNLTVACFAAGTRIMTARGEIAVEELAVGERVATTEGAAPIVWLGHRRIDCRRHPRPWDVQPVRIAAGAFAPGGPRRDVVLSPDHAILVDGGLVPARYLVNGATIVQEDVASVTYWHVELPAHAVLLAEGLPCESFLDTGNRSAFIDGGPVVQLAPDFSRATWEAKGCAPLVTEGRALTEARRRLFGRALAMGHALEDDPGVHLLPADGRIVPPRSVRGMRYRFVPGSGGRSLRLVSRAATPAQTGTDGADHRRLGVMVTRLVVREGDAWRAIALDTLTGAGWHAMEGEGAWRWTDGDAVLPPDAAGCLEFEVEIGAWARPWRRPATVAARARA